MLSHTADFLSLSVNKFERIYGFFSTVYEETIRP